MRQQIVAVTAAVLLVVLFLALWLSNLPGLPAVPYRAVRPQPTIAPTQVPPTPVVVIATPTPSPTPSPTPTVPPTPTTVPTPVPTATPRPTATRPPPTPTPRPHFLQVHEPADMAIIYGPPVTVVSGSTLPWSIVELIYSSSAFPERDVRVQADAAGNYAGTVPLYEGINVIEVIGYHGSSSQQQRQFLQVNYEGSQAGLTLTITDPPDGSTVTNRLLTVTGFVAPDAEVVVSGLIPASPDPTGQWVANLLLQPGVNAIRVVASRGEETTEAAITVTYQPDP